jgi:diaminohydroxyphosphoribosylaminopyrimidine deaminase/5-amino-6-(5-phosphoribosylamino)uracil reductase
VDGRTAMANGESQWITSEYARRDVHQLRARSSAMLTGINTVLADDPSLNARLDNINEEDIVQPTRVVVDSHTRMPLEAKMLSLPGTTVIATVNQDEHKTQQLRQRGADVVVVKEKAGRVDLDGLMKILAQRQINEVMVEAGPTLNGELLQHNLVDELIIYMAPCIMGDAARGMFTLPGVEKMQDRIELTIKDIRAVGQDWRISALVNKKPN